MSFPLAGTDWSFDVALRSTSEKKGVVAECKLRKEAVKQGQVAEFAFKVGKLRELHPDIEIAGMLVAKDRYQLGAVKTGQYEDIQIISLDDDAVVPGFNIIYRRYDAEREKVCRDIVMNAMPAEYRLG